MDLRHGYPEYTFHISYDADGFREYFEAKELIMTKGLLYPFKHTIPTDKELIDLKNQGYTVIANIDYLKIFNQDVSITWYLNSRKIVYEFYKDYRLLYRIQRFYEWNDNVHQTVLIKEIETTPYVLSTGDCAESESTTLYSDYAFNCSDSNDNPEI